MGSTARKLASVLLGVATAFICFTASTVQAATLSPVVTSTADVMDGQLANTNTLYEGQILGIFGLHFGTTYGRVTFDGKDVSTIAWLDDRVVLMVPSLPIGNYAPSKQIKVQVFIVNSNDGTEMASNTITRIYYQSPTKDKYAYLQSYLTVVGAPQSWSVPKQKQQVVAVIDDGVYVNHPELRNTIWHNPKEKIGNNKDDDKNGYVDDIYGWNFISNNGEMTTRGSHGTMVAGIIAAARNNDGISGINPDVKIMPIIVCDGQTGCPLMAVSKGIRYAVDNGATIINLSLGTNATTGFSTILDVAIKYAYDKGVVVVAAAGNGDTEGGIGQDLDIIPQSPVCNDVGKNAVIGVGAVTDERLPTSWSNFGSCVDVYAPGVAIVSTSVPASSSLGDFYDVESGTSFSAPIITGLISLVKQHYPLMPYGELLKRLKNNAYGYSIDAATFLSEAYVTPISIRQVEANKGIKADNKVIQKYSGTILIQAKGAQRMWYVRPSKGRRYEIKNENVQNILKLLSVMVTDKVLNSITSSSTKGRANSTSNKYKGQFLRTQTAGVFWYVSPKDGKKYQLKGKNIMQALTKLSGSISLENLNKLPIGLTE